jgi:hypothetical protein
MNENERQLREALNKIAELVSMVVNGGGHQDNEYDEGSEHAPEEYQLGCALKSLPQRLLVKAAETAVKINPVNAPMIGPFAAVAPGFAEVMDPLHLAVVTGKYWGPTPRRLTVSFMESTPANLRARIISQMNAWTQTGISFAETQGPGDPDLRGSGVLVISRDRYSAHPAEPSDDEPASVHDEHPESEYKRVVRHETGTPGLSARAHAAELVARIDPEKAYEYFRRTQGWEPRMVDQQVLTALDERSIMFTPPDQDSIMCYQLPGEITRDGQPIRGGRDINQTDYAFAGGIYPKPGRAQMSGRAQMPAHEEEWPESEDVEVPV